jgi:hypothetical protein
MAQTFRSSIGASPPSPIDIAIAQVLIKVVARDTNMPGDERRRCIAHLEAALRYCGADPFALG